MDPTIIGTIATIVFGTAQTGLAFSKEFIKVGRYESMAKNLQKIENYKLSDKESSNLEFMSEHLSDGHFKEIVTWLQYGEIIIPPMRAKLLSRLFYSVILFVGGAVFVPIDFSNYVLPESFGVIEIHDIPILLAMLLNFIAYLQRTIATEEEIIFMRNIGALHDAYYNRYVSNAMSKFNIHCAKYFNKEISDYESLLGGIRSDINELKSNLAELENNVPEKT